MLKAWFVRWQIQRAINAAWRSSDGAAARQQLFPDGKPDTDTFIKKLAEYVKEQMKQEKPEESEP